MRRQPPQAKMKTMCHFFSRLLMIPAIALGAILAALPAHAASSEWHENAGGRIRLVTAGQPDQNHHLQGVLEISLKPGWKTYWRDPGDSGVPPQIIPDGKYIRQANFEFPAPARHDDGYSQWAGYDHSVLLPVRFTLGPKARPEDLAAQVMIGICEKICIPVHASLALRPSQLSHEVVDETLVHNARAALPHPASENFGAELVSSTDATLNVEVFLPQDAHTADLFIAGEDGYVFDTPLLKNNGKKTIFEVAVIRRPAQKPSGKGVPYTLTSPQGAVSGFLPYP
ncbi:protein-disulfide reductase DsbD domain-containing protein [Aquamicrobium segne]|uniref:Protein-disulfide reductase DsbD domain-containing protein n=1 Tax=Aquamicrobium segne TaxID=469547 RepID=A0ABW0GUC6_9HYPH